MKIQVFEPPMCCSTGLCGPSVDPALVEFSANLDWLRRHGIEVERYNLSQQPAAFVSSEQIRELLQKEGNGCLPILVVDGKIASHGVYPGKEVLAQLSGLQVEAKAEEKGTSLKFTVQESADTSSSCCAPSSSGGSTSCCDSAEEAELKQPGKSCC